MMLCQDCGEKFSSKDSLRTHARDHHILEIYYGEAFVTLKRIDRSFECPVCEKSIETTRSCISHLKEQHNLSASTTEKRKGKEPENTEAVKVPRLDDPSSSSHLPPPPSSSPPPPSSPSPPPPSSSPSPPPPSSPSLIPPRPVIPSSLSSSQLPSSLLSPTKSLSYMETILATTDSIAAEKSVQQDKAMLVKLGRWTPVLFVDEEKGKQHSFLTNTETAANMIAKGKMSGRWVQPAADDVPKAEATVNEDILISHVMQKSVANAALKELQFEEMTQVWCSNLNRDWLLHPQMRYCGAALLAGAILIDGNKSIMLNTVEAYSRDFIDDAHAERRSSIQASSFPTKAGKYGHLNIQISSTADGDKLVLGTRTCNFLVTASCRLDICSVETGPATTHFLPSENTRVFLDKESAKSALSMLDNRGVSACQEMPALWMLKQVRSRFHKLCTYSMCRASSSLTSRLECQPCSIWTLCDQTPAAQKLSNERLSSLLFRAIALAVLTTGKEAKLSLETVDGVLKDAKAGTAAFSIIKNIKALFGKETRINIIDNLDLNSQLVDLANGIQNKTENQKKIVANIKKVFYC